MGMLSEFKDFAIKGNMIDMAVGFIMGGAFGTVVQSLVKDVIMPPVGLAMGGVDFSKLKIPLTDKVAINYGAFINSFISFLILAFCVFILVKGVNTAKKRFEKEKEAEAAASPPKQEVLLEEIRDALRAKS